MSIYCNLANTLIKFKPCGTVHINESPYRVERASYMWARLCVCVCLCVCKSKNLHVVTRFLDICAISRQKEQKKRRREVFNFEKLISPAAADATAVAQVNMSTYTCLIQHSCEEATRARFFLYLFTHAHARADVKGMQL